MSELEQKAKEIADWVAAQYDPPIDKSLIKPVCEKAALEALQLNQNIIDRMENQRKFDNDMIIEKDKTIASLQERCERLEAIDLSPVISWLENGCNVPDAIAELKIYREQMQALTETKGGEV